MTILQACHKKNPGSLPLPAESGPGFTLLEVLVAIVILGLSLVTLFELFAGSLKMARVSGDYLKATLLAQKKMNDLRLEDYAPEEEEKTGTFEEDPDYRWSVAVEPYATDFDRSPDKEEIKKVTVEIAWKRGRVPKVFRLVRLYNPMTWRLARGEGKGANEPGGRPGEGGKDAAPHISGNAGTPPGGGKTVKPHISGQ